jgi:hypothetical protein
MWEGREERRRRVLFRFAVRSDGGGGEGTAAWRFAPSQWRVRIEAACWTGLCIQMGWNNRVKKGEILADGPGGPVPILFMLRSHTSLKTKPQNVLLKNKLILSHLKETLMFLIINIY